MGRTLQSACLEADLTMIQELSPGRALLRAAPLLLAVACAGAPGEAGAPAVVQPVRLTSPSDPALPLLERERTALLSAGMTQVAMPFGVLLAADGDMPAAYVRQAAAILAELMDQDMDGVADDPTVAEALRRRDRAWLAMPMDDEAWEEEQLPQLERVLGYDIIIPEWWMEVRGPDPHERARAVMVEEVHHFMTQFGFSEVYPDVFGVEDWSSVIAREAQRARCDFWQHPENDCPGRPAESPGDCSDPSCDVVEFYQQVAVLRAGMEPGWRGIGFPRDRAELEAKLGPEIKAAMEDPRYHQLRAPLSFAYPVE